MQLMNGMKTGTSICKAFSLVRNADLKNVWKKHRRLHIENTAQKKECLVDGVTSCVWKDVFICIFVYLFGSLSSVDSLDNFIGVFHSSVSIKTKGIRFPMNSKQIL